METPVTIILIALTVLPSMMAFSDQRLLERMLFEVGGILRRGEQYRIVSSAFVHGDTMHLFFNMFTLYFFGRVIEHLYGFPKMLAIYFAAVIGGSLLALLIHRNEPRYRALGASGGVSGILFTFVVLFPNELLYLFAVVPIPSWLFAVLYLGFTYRGMITQGDNIGHDAHLGGALIGVLAAVIMVPEILTQQPLLLGAIVIICVAGTFFFVRKQKMPRLKRERVDVSKPHARRYHNPSRKKKQEIDRILDKVSREGYDALTPPEKKLLDKHAQNEQNRRRQ